MRSKEATEAALAGPREDNSKWEMENM